MENSEGLEPKLVQEAVAGESIIGFYAEVLLVFVGSGVGNCRKRQFQMMEATNSFLFW